MRFKAFVLALLLLAAPAFASIVDVDPATGRQIVLIDAFSYNGQYNVKATGFQGTAPQHTTTNVDFAVGAEDRYIQGVRLILKNHAFSDTVDFQIVDKDNVLGYGAGAVLNQFAYSWNVNSEVQDQGQTSFNYVARIPAGTYLRVAYHGTGSILSPDVQILLNCLFHKKIAALKPLAVYRRAA